MSGGIVVGLAVLRKALVTVRAFADPKDNTKKYNAVRLIPDDMVLYVTATDQLAAAIARVEILERYTADADFIDLDLVDVRKILDVFQMPKDDDSAAEDACLRIDARAKEVVVTDVSGMFEGDSLTVQTTPRDTQDVRRLFTPDRLLPTGILRQDDPRFGLYLPTAQRLTLAAKTYGYTITLHGINPATESYHAHRLVGLATCGPHFMATFDMPITASTELETRHEWAQQLRAATATPPAADHAAAETDPDRTVERDDVGGYSVRRLASVPTGGDDSE